MNLVASDALALSDGRGPRVGDCVDQESAKILTPIPYTFRSKDHRQEVVGFRVANLVTSDALTLSDGRGPRVGVGVGRAVDARCVRRRTGVRCAG